MRRSILTLFLSLLFTQLFGNDGIPSSHQILKKVYFPVIETPACFTSTIHDKEFLIFIEYSDSLHINGHYMAMEEVMTDTLPFKLEAKGGVILESAGNNVKVAWFGNAPKHSLTASTLLPHGLGLNTTKIIN